MFKLDHLKIYENVPLAPMTTFSIGGKASYFCQVGSPDELIKAVNWALKKSLHYKIFSGGSNILFPDENLTCLVIRNLGGKISVKKNSILADAGVWLSNLIENANSEGLTGLEKMVGIPGTLGGAIVGNAGAYGQSISDVVQKVQIWDGEKKSWLNKSICQFGYRESIFKKSSYLVLGAKLKLETQDPKILKNTSQKTLLKRKNIYPPGIKTAGCFFKNLLAKNVSPESLKLIDKEKVVYGKIPAGYLLDQVGAKNMKLGDIKVANWHANFLINTGEGKAKDVLKLAEILKQKVKDRFGIRLEEEVRIIKNNC